MRDVDLATFEFDFDLTFAVLAMHPDGTIYHRFGGRDDSSATSWVSMPPLLRVLERGLEAHEAYAKNPRPVTRESRTIASYPYYAKWAKTQKKNSCIHCHQVGEMEVRSADDRGGFDKESVWRYPSPAQVGLVMDPERQDRVEAVIPDSPAAAADFRAGDVIKAVRGLQIASVTDFQAALHGASNSATDIPVAFQRNGADAAGSLALRDGWKKGTVESFAWRALKWPMTPIPGFGGDDLTKGRKKRLGLDPEQYAFQVTYLVTWGPKGHVGRNAANCGLRNKDIVYSVAGKTDFQDQQHFQAWFRLRRTPGEVIELKILRGKTRKTVKLKVVK